MKKFHVPDKAFYGIGPFEAENKESLADTLTPLFTQWATKALSGFIESHQRERLPASIAFIRQRFLESLEEVP